MSQFKPAAVAALGNAWPHGIRITEADPVSPTEGSTPSMQQCRLSIYKSLAAAWKWLERRRHLQLSARRLRVMETLSLGEKRNLLIVTVDGAQFLIGSSAAGVQLLTKLDEVGQTSTAAVRQGREWSS